jgi:hypothetical protein
MYGPFVTIQVFHKHKQLIRSSSVLLKKLIVAHLIKILPNIPATRRFTTVFTRGLHRYLSLPHCTSSMPHTQFLSNHFNFIFPNSKRFPKSLFASGFQVKMLQAILISPVCVRGSATKSFQLCDHLLSPST